jgi:hypothetical protein
VNGIAILTSTAADFQTGMSLPFVLQGQLADLRVQRLEVRPGVPLVAGRREYLGGTRQQLRAPLADLVWVDLELLRQLDQRLVAADGGQRHLRLERR